MDINEIEELIRLIERSDVEEFELERAGTRIRVKKPARGGFGPGPSLSIPAAPAGAEPDGAPSPVAESPQPDEEPKEALYEFKAPIVGTFYITPKPDADPLVEPGSPVEPGQVLCVIEAMKIFNQIEADVSGEVVRVLVENGQPVEYGQALFEIRLSSQSDVQEDSSRESR